MTMGSTQIRKLRFGESWAFIGVKGQKEFVIEKRGNEKAETHAHVENTFTMEDLEEITKDIGV